MKQNLEEISKNYRSDKGNVYHNYLQIYEKYFSKYRNSLKTFLEIGLWEGESIRMWRDYFEGVYPFIVSRSGYFPYLENRVSCSCIDLYPYVERWINTNNLENYKKYLNLFKTDFIFKQEFPPYVNSNT